MAGGQGRGWRAAKTVWRRRATRKIRCMYVCVSESDRAREREKEREDASRIPKG